MDQQEFWSIVKQIDWPGAIRSEGSAITACKARAMKALPSKENCDAFMQHYNETFGRLHDAVQHWESDTGSCIQIGDDSYGDLLAHVIGLGEVEVERSIKSPRLLLKRTEKPYGKVDSYLESFCYCLPSESDYDAPELKLEREEDALNYWIERQVEGDRYAESEVARRCEIVGRLRALVYGLQNDQQAVESMVRAKLIASKQEQIKSLCAKKNEIEDEINRILVELDQLHLEQKNASL